MMLHPTQELEPPANPARFSALRIGVHGIVAGGSLDRLLDRFRGLHAGVSLHIIESTARDAQIQMREDRLDVAFIACTHEIPELRSRVIWRDRLMVAMPEAHRWRNAIVSHGKTSRRKPSSCVRAALARRCMT
ncbi:hypothetical protein DEA98_28195 [Brucella pseudogrignonensis]|nr:hypothetical protein [Brucella pseudogrignonensis]